MIQKFNFIVYFESHLSGISFKGSVPLRPGEKRRKFESQNLFIVRQTTHTKHDRRFEKSMTNNTQKALQTTHTKHDRRHTQSMTDDIHKA